MANRNLGQLQTDVQNLVHDTRLSADLITVWINEAMADLTPVLRLQAKTPLSLVAGQADYAAPNDLFSVFLLRVSTDTDPLPPIPLGDFESTGYKVWNKVITIQPTPTDAGTADLWYFRTTAVVSSTSQYPDIPDQFQHLLVLYAAARYMNRDEELDEKSDFYADYLRGKASLDRYTARQVAAHLPRSFKVVRHA